MNSAVQRLQSLLVSDVMTDIVVQVGVHQNMAEAAEIMKKHHVSLAPVVDEQGRCVGVLSATDFLSREMSDEDETLAMEQHQLVQPAGDQPLQLESGFEDCVSRYMTQGIQSVAADSSMMNAARVMYAQHLHRLLVMDHLGRPQGVISTMDVISALVNAIDEMHQSEPFPS